MAISKKDVGKKVADRIIRNWQGYLGCGSMEEFSSMEWNDLSRLIVYEVEKLHERIEELENKIDELEFELEELGIIMGQMSDAAYYD